MPQFALFGLSPAIVRALREEGYAKPTPIQAQSITPVMQGRDLLGCAQTGTGKTAAFALPILHRLTTAPLVKMRRAPSAPQVLVLSPTRELATQIGQSFTDYGRHTSLVNTVIFGGVNQFHQVKALQRGVDILVATPGRLLDLLQQRLVNLGDVRIFVLDEADRMLDMGFINPIRRITAMLPKPPARQTLLFSATMPKEIMHLADSLLHEPVKVAVTPVAETTDLIEQSVYMVQRSKKAALLLHFLADAAIERALVFTRTKHGADRLSRLINHTGVACDAIHGNKGQNQRTRALEGFRSGRTRVLVGTDVAARGLDVDGITHVFNYDLPLEPEAYVHRIGRTGRAGASGRALSFCDPEEQDLLRDIERLIGRRVPQVRALPKLADEAPVPRHQHQQQEQQRRQHQHPQQQRRQHQHQQQPRQHTRAGSQPPARPARAPRPAIHVARPAAHSPRPPARAPQKRSPKRGARR